MRWGLRVQLLVLLAVLLLVIYLPLAFAVSTYTRVGLQQLQQENAYKLGRSVASHLAGLRAGTDPEAFLQLARAQIANRSVHALTLYDVSGRAVASLGELELLRPLQNQHLLAQGKEVQTISTSLGRALRIVAPSAVGYVGATIRYDADITGARDLSKLLGLYLGLSALALILALYFALTRLIVRPIVDLEAAADRVAAGARRLLPPRRAPREVMQLAHRLSQMTNRLLDEEEQLRAKVVEIETKTAELKQAQGSVVRSERLATVGRLAAGLAHEVGNPISALMGLQDLMLTGELSREEELDFLKRMKKETARIDRVICDLLAYARPSADRASSERIGSSKNPPGQLRQAALDVLSLLKPQTSFKQLHLEAELHSGPDEVTLPHNELTQVLMNLVMNARDACEAEGHIVIRSYMGHDPEADEERLFLLVQDDGPGIDPKVRENLFEPFVTTKDVGKGTGLGLSVSKGLVEAVAGTISVQETEGGGATFILSLPKRTGKSLILE